MPDPGRIELVATADISPARGELLKLKSDLESIGDAIDAQRQREITIQIDQALTQLDKLEREAKSFGDEIDQHARIEFEAKTERAQRDIKDLVRTSQRELDKLRRVSAKNPFDALSKSAAQESTELVREFQRIERNFQRTVERLNRAARRTDFDASAPKIRNLREQVRLAAQDVVLFANRVPRELRQVGTGFDLVERKAREARQEIKRFNQSASTGSFQKLKNSLKGLSSTIKGDLIFAIKAYLAALVVDRIIEFARASVKLAADLETLEGRFEAVTGSEEKAAERLQSLREISDIYGASLKGLRDNYPPFIKSLENSNLALETQEAIYESLGIAAAGAGSANVKFERAMAAVVQIASKGKVEMEELTGQLAEALPGGLAALANELGITEAELRKLTKSGELLANEALPAIAAGLLKAYGPSALERIDDANTKFTRFKNVQEDISKVLGEELLPGVLEVLEALVSMKDEGESIVELFGSVGGDILETLGSALRILGDIANVRIGPILAEAVNLFVELGRKLPEIVLGLLDFVTKVFPPLNRHVEKLRESYKQLIDDTQQGIKDQAQRWREGAEDQVSATEQANEQIRKHHETLNAALEKGRKEKQRQEREFLKETEKAQKEAAAASLKATKEHFSEYVNAAKSAYNEAAKAAKEGHTDAARAAFLAARDAAEAAKDAAREIIETTGDVESKAVDAARKAAEKAVEFANQAYDQMVEAVRRAAEEEEKIHEKRRKLFEDAATDLAKAFETPKDEGSQPAERVQRVRVTGGVDGDLSSRLSGLRQELAALERQKREIETAPLITLEQLSQVDQMRDRIHGLTAEISTLERQATHVDLAAPVGEGADQITKQGQAVLDALRKMTLGTSDFQDALAQLPTAARENALLIIRHLEDIADNSEISADEVRQHMGDLARVLEQGSEGTAGYADAWDKAAAQIGDDSRSISDQLADLAERSVAAAEATRASGDAASEVGGQVRQLGEDTDFTREHLVGIRNELQQAGDTSEAMGTSLEDLRQQVRKAGQDADDTAERVRSLAEEEEALGLATDDLAEGLGGLDVSPFRDELDGVGDSASSAADGVGQAADEVDRLAGTDLGSGQSEDLGQLGEASSQAADGVSKAAEAAERAQAGIGQLGSLVGQLQTQVGELVQRLDELVERSGDEGPLAKLAGSSEQLQALIEPLQQTVNLLGTGSTHLAGIAEQIEPVTSGLQSLLELLADEEAAGPLGERIEQIGQLREQLSGAAEDLSTIQTTLESLIQSAEPVDAATQTIRAALDRLVERELVEQLGQLAEDLGTIQERIQSAATSTTELTEASQQWADQVDTLIDKVSSLEQALGDSFQDTLDSVEEAFSGLADSARDLVDKVGELEEKGPEAFDKTKESVDALNESMAETLRLMDEIIQKAPEVEAAADRVEN